jgi:hypothetical protein
MAPRLWATFGNMFQVSAALGFVAEAVIAYRVIELSQQGLSTSWVILGAAGVVVSFLLSILFWNLKGMLLSGNFIARVLVSLYMASSIVFSAGFALIPIAVFYAFTGEPDVYATEPHGRPSKPRFTTPVGWHASGHVGPSGATLYTEPNRHGTAGIFDSWTPVQVMDRRDGYARVVAETGEGGWIDLRTLMEPA